jgi:hypothetical protein
VLDNTALVYGSGISDGDRHNHDDLPVLVAGKAAGTIKPGRHMLALAHRLELAQEVGELLDMKSVDLAELL